MAQLSALEHAEESYRTGRFIDAWAALARIDETARDGRAKTLELRLLHHLGAPMRARRATLAAFRSAPRDNHARGRTAFSVLELRGPLAARDWVTRYPVTHDECPVLEAESRELQAVTLICLRDFTAARRVLDEWKERGLAPADRLGAEVQLLACMPRLSQAVSLAREALETNPKHRRLVMVLAGALTSSGHTQEAITLLRASSADMQCAPLLQMLYALALATDDHQLGARTVEQLPSLLPHAEPEVLAMLTLMRAENFYRRGDIASARLAVSTGEDPMTKRFAARLEDDGSVNRRKRLDVPFVQQEQLGCVPATLTALARFHGREADQLELAERICYHGTAAYAERSWADSHGFATREMRLTWETAVRLIERDVPFVVTTFVPGAGHAQAVIGFDERRRTLILRDPSLPLPLEVDADAFIEEYRYSGPRCLVVVPREKAAVLDGLALEDAALYDALYELEGALDAHDRERAVEASSRLASLAPGHRIARAGKRALAAYDENPVAVLEIAEEALAADPRDRLAAFDRLTMQQAVTPRSLRIEALERAATEKGATPVFVELLASELSTDDRERRRARRLSNQVLRARPDSARSVHLLGLIAWQQGDAERGLDLFRFAACLEPTNEPRVRHYVFAARKAGRFAEALAFLREHFDTFGARNADPAIVLADALDESGDAAGASAALDRACALRPDDGRLLLTRSRIAANEGRSDEARALLDSARGKVDRITWSRGAAVVRVAEGASEEEQLEAWRAVADAAPLAMDAQMNVATLLRRTQGQRASAAFLASRVERFPHHRPTVHAYLASLRDADVAVQEAALRAFLTTEPTDAWAHRELALLLSSETRADEAEVEVEAAARLGGRSVELHLTRAALAERRNDHTTARTSYLEALAVDADAATASSRVMDLAEPAERYALVQALFEQAERGAIVGSTFEVLYMAAAPHVEPGWFIGALARLRAVRSEMATVWTLSIRHALTVGPPSAAATLAEEALARFPLVPEVHLAAAEAWSILGDSERAVEQLRRAVELGPQLSSALARLANELEARGERDAVDELLERARRRAFFDSTISLEGARVRARRGEHVAAIEQTVLLLEREPDLQLAWNMLLGIAAEAERPAAVAAAARIASSNPGSETAQAGYAMLLLEAGSHADALALLDAAVSRGMRGVLLRDARASALALAGRHDEALVACAALEGEPPSVDLGFRTAWVHANAGRLPEAIAVLEGVLHQTPSFVGGWQRLVDWSIALSDLGRAHGAAMRLVSLAPMAASSQATLARVLLAGGDQVGAVHALLRTVERDPGAVAAAQQLFVLAGKQRDAVALRAAGAVLERQLPDALRVAIDVELALAREAPNVAMERFANGCLDTEAPEPDVVAACEVLHRAGLGQSADRSVERALSHPAANPAVGRLWMRAGMAHDATFALSLASLPASTKIARSAALAAFETLAQNPYKARTRLHLRRLGGWLRSDDVTWSAPLTTLVMQRSYWGAVWWGRSWASRAGAPPALMHVLGVAMHAVGLRRRGLRLMRRMTEQTPGDDGACFRAWLAFDEAALGHTEEAARMLSLVEGRALPPTAFLQAWLAGALVELQRAEPGGRDAVYAKQRDHLEQKLVEAAKLPSMRDSLGRCRWRLARDLRRLTPLFRGHPALQMSVLVALGIGGTALSSRSTTGDSDTAVVMVILLACVLAWLLGRAVWRAVLARV